jgi:hypothetical protein
VALLVARDVRHPLGEAGHGARLGEVVLDVVLAGLRERRLDDHVVEGDRAGEVGQRAVPAQVRRHPVEAVEDVSVPPIELRLGVGERRGDRIAGADHLPEEAVKEHRVARLVDLLRGQEVLLLGGRRRVDVRGEVVGDRVLAVEEHRVDPERGPALDLAERVPSVAVAAQVDRARAPVSLLPAGVEVVVAERIRGPDPVLVRDAHLLASSPRRRG